MKTFLITLTLIFSVSSFGAQKIKHCGGKSHGEVKKSLGLLVGKPYASKRQPAGTSIPFLLATDTFPPAIALVAISNTIGPLEVGTAQQNGLVLIRASRPPQGETTGG